MEEKGRLIYTFKYKGYKYVEYDMLDEERLKKDGVLEEDIPELVRQAKVKRYLEKVDELCDYKSIKAEYLIAQKEVSVTQRERYKIKARHARNVTGRNNVELEQIANIRSTNDNPVTVEDLINNSKMILTPSAIGVGVTVEEYAEIIVQTEQKWTNAIDIFYGLIESYKSKCYQLIKEGRFEELEDLLEFGKDIGKTVDEKTPQELITITYQTIVDKLDELS